MKINYIRWSIDIPEQATPAESSQFLIKTASMKRDYTFDVLNSISPLVFIAFPEDNSSPGVSLSRWMIMHTRNINFIGLLDISHMSKTDGNGGYEKIIRQSLTLSDCAFSCAIVNTLKYAYSKVAKSEIVRDDGDEVNVLIDGLLNLSSLAHPPSKEIDRILERHGMDVRYTALDISKDPDACKARLQRCVDKLSGTDLLHAFTALDMFGLVSDPYVVWDTGGINNTVNLFETWGHAIFPETGTVASLIYIEASVEPVDSVRRIPVALPRQYIILTLPKQPNNTELATYTLIREELSDLICAVK